MSDIVPGLESFFNKYPDDESVFSVLVVIDWFAD